MSNFNTPRVLFSCIAAFFVVLIGCGDAGGNSGGNFGEQALEGNRGNRCDDMRDIERVRNPQLFKNENGQPATFSTRDRAFLDTNNAFFQSLGTNDRTCETCHTAEDGWSVSVANIQKRFKKSCGLDPIFRTVDGADNPTADVSTLTKRREAYSLLLNKGLIRMQVQGLGSTSAEGVAGDPRTLSTQEFFVNINRDASTFPTALSEKTLRPDVFTLFNGWVVSANEARAAVARGQALFNRRESFDPVGGPDTTCAECHDAPNAGSSPAPRKTFHRLEVCAPF